MAENVVEARNLHPLSSASLSQAAVTLHAKKEPKREMKIGAAFFSHTLPKVFFFCAKSLVL